MFVFSDQLELPFSQWSRQMVLSWLDDLGLGHYSSQCGKVITCGQDLLKASPAQLERDMGLKNPLHRKKLQLALQVHWPSNCVFFPIICRRIFCKVKKFAYSRNSSISVLQIFILRGYLIKAFFYIPMLLLKFWWSVVGVGFEKKVIKTTSACSFWLSINVCIVQLSHMILKT